GKGLGGAIGEGAGGERARAAGGAVIDAPFDAVAAGRVGIRDAAMDLHRSRHWALPADGDAAAGAGVDGDALWGQLEARDRHRLVGIVRQDVRTIAAVGAVPPVEANDA